MNNKVRRTVTIMIVLLPVVISLLCIGAGRYSLSVGESIQVLLHALTGGRDFNDPQAYSVIVHVRLPRILLALLCGMGLSLAGTALQALFSNPLASPDILGVSAGAGFGAALALLLSLNLVFVQIFALAFGLAAVAIAIFIGRSKAGSSIILMVLGGVVVSYMFQAFVSLIKYVADTESKLPAITYWLMGSLTGATYSGLLIGAPFILTGCIILYALRWRLNILSLGEEEAKSMGINVKRLRLYVIVASTMITAACVSMCGLVGWVGLLMPHIARMMFGTNNSKVVPISMCLGGSFLVVVDTFARAATAAEIPISILTAVIGAPFFIVLLKRTGGAWR
jgi:iron complex transport system permease protein